MVPLSTHCKELPVHLHFRKKTARTSISSQILKMSVLCNQLPTESQSHTFVSLLLLTYLVWVYYTLYEAGKDSLPSEANPFIISCSDESVLCLNRIGFLLIGDEANSIKTSYCIHVFLTQNNINAIFSVAKNISGIIRYNLQTVLHRCSIWFIIKRINK